MYLLISKAGIISEVAIYQTISGRKDKSGIDNRRIGVIGVIPIFSVIGNDGYIIVTANETATSKRQFAISKLICILPITPIDIMLAERNFRNKTGENRDIGSTKVIICRLIVRHQNRGIKLLFFAV